VTLNINNDSTLADGVETVTVTLKRAEGETEITVPGALRRGLVRPHETYSGVALQGEELVWNIPHEPLDDASLQRGDTIADAADSVWTILSASLLTLGTRWRCVCRKEQ
jgi:hypothetical protein